MKLKKTLDVKEEKKEDLSPHKIDLNQITKIVNQLNEIIAPTIVEDLCKVKKVLEEKHAGTKTKIEDLKKLNDETIQLKEKKSMLTKRLTVVSLLAQMHGNFVVTDNIKRETLTILSELDKYPVKRLDAQINKLESILKGS